DEPTDSKKEVRDVGVYGQTPAYQTRSISRQLVTVPQFDERDDSSKSGFSLDGPGSNLKEDNGNKAISSLSREAEPLKGYVINAKTPRFWESGADRSKEGPTTIGQGHLKRSFSEEVRIIDSMISEFPKIGRGYQFYGLGWMSEAPGSYFPNMVREFYANYAATVDSMCKKAQKASKIPIHTKVQVHVVLVDISTNTINRMLYGTEFALPARTMDFDNRTREWHNQHL
ncbi:hypothetical protein HAX54_032038, partial [Datura stramonium]|nr:hypothetical protein [Datura stramonium]